MKIRSFCILFTAAVLSCTGLSLATVTGLPTSGGSYATWDTFPSASFSDDAPDYSSTTAFSATLTFSLTNVFGMPYPSDRAYDANGDATMTINGLATGSITTLAIQMKTTASDPLASITVSLNGNAYTGSILLVGVGETVGSGPQATPLNVYQWTWSGLTIGNGDSFNVSIASTQQHASLDAVRISDTSAEAVPEPSTWALLGMSLVGGAIWHIRRKKNAAAA